MGRDTLTVATHQDRGDDLAIDFTVLDGAGNPWTLSEHLDAAAVITFHRGDF